MTTVSKKAFYLYMVFIYKFFDALMAVLKTIK